MAAARGWVQDPAGRGLVGARVEALDGPSAGTFAVVGGDGTFDYQGAFTLSTQFRASYDGHESAVDTPRCSVANCADGERPWMVFSLRPLETPVDPGCDYTLADRSCRVPAHVISEERWTSRDHHQVLSRAR